MAGTRKEKKETQHIQAFARLRPFNSQELEFHAKRCVELHGKDIVVNMQHGTRQYSFDKVFDINSKQKDVYISVVNPLLAEVIQGYNCTIFAYGQTGSGKTYTMVGSPTPSSSSYLEDSDAGIIPRTLAHLFESLNKNSELDFTIRVSYLELYNEVLIDLLSSEDKSLKIYEDQKNKGSVQIYGLEEVTVFDKHQVYEILQRGTEKRQTAMTLLNSQSSRSHTVFTVTLHSRETTLEGEELVKTGKLNLVDLAGSENIQRSGAMDKRAREAGNINQSLLTLGRVIKALVEKSSHVPYRESKLTRILQDSLGGRTKTAIIATISPAANNMEESMSTLDYAHRSRNITNRPEANLRMSKTALIQGYLEQIDRLKKDVLAARNQEGIYLNPDNYNLMVAESEKRKEDLLKSVAECATFESTVQELEHKKKELEQVYHVTKTELEGATGSLEKSKENVKKLREERQIHQELIDKFEQAETELIDDNRSLSNSLNRYLSEHHALRNKLDNLYNANDKNDNTARELQNNITMSCAFTSEKCQCFANSIKEKTQWVHNDMTEAMTTHEDHFKITSNIMQDLQTSFVATMQKTLSDIEALNMKQLQSINDCINEHQHTLTKIVPSFSSYNKIIEDNFKKFTEKLHMCSTTNAQIALDIKNIAETHKRLSGNIESITHDLDTLANMTKKNLDVVTKKFQNAESDLEKAMEKLLACNSLMLDSNSLMQKHKSTLADSCKVLNELIEENDTHTAHAQTTCNTMQKVIDDSTTIICNDTAGMTEKIQHAISDMVKLKELDENHQKEVVVLMGGVKISQEKTLEQLTAHVAYNKEEHGKIVTTYRDLINNHNNMSSSLQEKLDDHDKAIVTSSERVFTVLGDLEKDTTSNTHLISKDINVIKDTVDKYVQGLVVVKPSGDTPARSDEKNSYNTPKRVIRSIRPMLTIPHHDTSLEEEVMNISSSEESSPENVTA